MSSSSATKWPFTCTVNSLTSSAPSSVPTGWTAASFPVRPAPPRCPVSPGSTRTCSRGQHLLMLGLSASAALVSSLACAYASKTPVRIPHRSGPRHALTDAEPACCVEQRADADPDGPAALELRVGVEGPVGGDEFDMRRVRPSVEELAQEAGDRALADGDRSGHADNERRRGGVRLAEEGARSGGASRRVPAPRGPSS